ncbi:hypothetical protein ACIRPK_35390 [Kitasatospora sp. NPDC101801]|uniref:hypothetical protein n=1 Tax=Kitasatospora sp. NPDC101801 TaxID=3364103 RepID=UPI003830E280
MTGCAQVICAKSLAGQYVVTTPSRSTWVKVRHTATVDAQLVGVTKPARRPETALVRLPDGRQEVTTPRLTAVQAARLAEAVTRRLRPSTEGPGGAGAFFVAVQGSSAAVGTCPAVRQAP